MDVRLSDEARDLIESRGGSAVVDIVACST